MMSASDGPPSPVAAHHQGGGRGGRTGAAGGGGGGGSGAARVIRPAPVTEQSLMESVAGFINDVQVRREILAVTLCKTRTVE